MMIYTLSNFLEIECAHVPPSPFRCHWHPLLHLAFVILIYLLGVRKWVVNTARPIFSRNQKELWVSSYNLLAQWPTELNCWTLRRLKTKKTKSLPWPRRLGKTNRLKKISNVAQKQMISFLFYYYEVVVTSENISLCYEWTL